MENLLQRLLLRVTLGKDIMVIIVVAVDKLAVRRRNAIMNRIRRLQAILNIPPFPSVVSDNTAPSVTGEVLRFGAELDVYSVLISIKTLGLIAGLKEFKGLQGFASRVIIWIYFIFARRRFDQRERGTHTEGVAEEDLKLWGLKTLMGAS
ncbi:hypothetical protein F5X98DRAFT_377072 [Xylaria grammica]|nr:hypothetical protein F5X98DRAFT_377072 [Xylaria grammica]